MRQLVVISGKGGTGKTTVVASLAQLASRSERVVLADCDVEAANLALLLPGTDVREEPFFAGQRARVDPDECVGCGECVEVCRFGAIRVGRRAWVDRLACEGCGACARVCPVETISFDANQAGWWMERTDSSVPLVHARLGTAQDSSGKLVARVREQARDLATREDAELIIVDGPPGIGCPVHASLTGCDLALVVTEPTPSGEHDLARALELLGHFGIPAAVLLNKHGLSPDVASGIGSVAARSGAPVVGRIPFDRRVPGALARAELPLDLDSFAGPLEEAWGEVATLLEQPPAGGANP